MTDYYAELCAQSGGEPARMDGWRHRLEQWLRFEVVRRGLEISPTSKVLDLGCGTGRLFEYLKIAAPGVYVGVDRRSDVLARAREDFGDGASRFVEADWNAPAVDEQGPFDFAVAIGTMVDGEQSSSGERRRQLARLVTRLHETGGLGWALVALNQTRLEDDPVRSLEPFLKGSRAVEVKALLRKLGVDAMIDSQVIPTDLVVIHRRDEKPWQIADRVAGDEAQEAVLERAQNDDGDIDGAQRAWFWMVTGRLKRARQALDEVPDSNQRKRLLSEQLRLRERAGNSEDRPADQQESRDGR